MKNGGYQLKEIAAALSDVYGLSASETTKELSAVFTTNLKEITEAVDSVYGGNGYLVAMIQYWKSQPGLKAQSVYQNLMVYSGVSEHVTLYKAMIAAGYTESDVITAMYARSMKTISVLKEIHGDSGDTVRHSCSMVN